MVENIVYFSPILVLICGLIWLFAEYLNRSSLNRVFRLTKLSLIMSFGLTVIFYNKTAFPSLAKADLFSVFFQVVMYMGAFAVLFLSRKWYAGTDTDEHLFCGSLLLSVIAGNLLAVSENLALTTISACLFMLSGCLLFLHAERGKENSYIGRLYSIPSFIFALSAIVGATTLYFLNYDLSYESLATYFEIHKENPYVFCLLVIFVLLFVFLLGLSPFHFWYTETSGAIILPIFTYFTIVPIGAYFAGFIKMNLIMLSTVHSELAFFYKCVGILAMFSGAIGSCSGKNVRKIFAYGVVFHLGIVLLVMQQFTPAALNIAILYLIVFLLAMYGVCATLYGLKSKGEYLFSLNDFAGAAVKRPYISFMLMLFLFSLIGFPPFLGFLGIFSVLNNLVETGGFYFSALLMIFLTIVACGYLQIIKTLYFENSALSFDRADRGIYLVICLNFLLMEIIMLKPDFWTGNLQFIVEGAFSWII